MQSALDRRQAILELLSDRRQTTLDSLALEFGVSKMTIRRDIEILSCSAPIYTLQGNGGGIRVAQLDAHQEAIQLGFWQGEGAGLILGVLRGDDEEGIRQWPGDAIQRDLLFGHGFEQGTLGTWAATVDLIG